MNIIIVLCKINFLIFFFHYCVTTEILSIMYDLPKIENIYLNYLAQREPTGNIIASLTKQKYVSLCQQIFELTHYRDIGVYLNKSAFYMKKPPFHVELSITLQTKILFNDEKVTQKVYPCYGRYKVFRTNFKTDDFYDKFFIIPGIDINSVLVIFHQNFFEDDDYHVYDYLINIKLDHLSDTNLSAEEVREELQLKDYVIISQDSSRVESTYVRNQNLLTADPLCKMSKEELTTICDFMIKIIPDMKDIFEVTLNWTAMKIYPVKCVDKYLIFRYWPRFKNEKITRKMIPCYARRVSAPSNTALFDKYTTFFYMSSGSRLNSIYLYGLNTSNEIDESFNVLYLIENIFIDKFGPTKITKEIIQQESPNIIEYISLYYVFNQVNTIQREDEQELRKIQNPTEHYLINVKSLRQLRNYRTEINNSNKFIPFGSIQEMKEFVSDYINQCTDEKLDLILEKSFDENFEEETIPSNENRINVMKKVSMKSKTLVPEVTEEKKSTIREKIEKNSAEKEEKTEGKRIRNIKASKKKKKKTKGSKLKKR